MRSLTIFACLALSLRAQLPPIARFQGSFGASSIQGIVADEAGNIYVAGTTAASDFVVKNAMQPLTGEAPILRSTDAGKTWQRLPNVPSGTSELAPHPVNSQVLLISGEQGIDKSTNGGQAWQRVYSWEPVAANILFKAGPVDIAIDPANPALVYVLRRTNGSLLLLFSDDGGETWQKRALPPTEAFLSDYSDPVRKLFVDQNGSGTVILGMATSRDRGLSWRSMSYPSQLGRSRSVVPDPHHSGWFLGLTSRGATNYLYFSNDWGLTWSEKKIVVDPIFDSNLPNVIYARTTAGALIVSRDNAETWTLLSEAYHGTLTALSRQCGGVLFSTVSPKGVASSSDFGLTWSVPEPLTLVKKLTTGPGCAVYAVRSTTSDAFVAKLSPLGEVLWSTFFGGMDLDAAVSISLGPNGTVYVAGTTASPDFPTTTPRASGQSARRDAFVARFDQNGALIFSSVFGGEIDNLPTTLSVDVAGDAYVAGAGGRPGVGFVSKVSSDGRVFSTTNLRYDITFGGVSQFSGVGIPRSPLPIVAENDGTALVAGSGETLFRLTGSGSLEPVAKLPGPIQFVAFDNQGDLYVAGHITTPPISSKSCSNGFISLQLIYMPGADSYVTKLKSGTFDPIFTKRFAGGCRTQPTAMAISPTGEIALRFWTKGSFPLRDPVFATFTGSAIVLLSANGVQTHLSTYAGTSALTFGENNALIGTQGDAIVQLPVRRSGTLSIESIANTMTGYESRIESGSLFTIFGRGFAATAIDQGLATPGPLPRILGGVQVFFNGLPAEILQASPTYVICVAPADLTYSDWVTVQVKTETEESTPFLVLGAPLRTALLTRDFPALPSEVSDGEIRNADGTQNSPRNPAERGTTVTLFATGITERGQVALFWSPKPYVPNPRPVGPTGVVPVYGTAGPMPGFLPLLWEIKFAIPTALGPGVDFLPPVGVSTRVVIGSGNSVGIWIK